MNKTTFIKDLISKLQNCKDINLRYDRSVPPVHIYCNFSMGLYDMLVLNKDGIDNVDPCSDNYTCITFKSVSSLIKFCKKYNIRVRTKTDTKYYNSEYKAINKIKTTIDYITKEIGK